MHTPDRPRRDPDRQGGGTIAAGVGIAVLMVICCAAPVLLAAGVLGAIGAWLSNPWVIGAAVALAATAAVSVLARRGRAGQSRNDQDACCPPTPTSLHDPTDRKSRPAPEEGPRHRRRQRPSPSPPPHRLPRSGAGPVRAGGPSPRSR